MKAVCHESHDCGTYCEKEPECTHYNENSLGGGMFPKVCHLKKGNNSKKHKIDRDDKVINCGYKYEEWQ